MMYWAKTNGIEIDTAVFFVKIVFEDMVQKERTQEDRWQCIKVWKVRFHIPRTTQKAEEEIRREEAAAESQGTMTQ